MKNKKTFPKWSLHIDGPWSQDVREYGAPLRLYSWTPWGFLTIALWPGHGSQVYDWKKKKWTDKWSWITFGPRGDRR